LKSCLPARFFYQKGKWNKKKGGTKGRTLGRRGKRDLGENGNDQIHAKEEQMSPLAQAIQEGREAISYARKLIEAGGGSKKRQGCREQGARGGGGAKHLREGKKFEGKGVY